MISTLILHGAICCVSYGIARERDREKEGGRERKREGKREREEKRGREGEGGNNERREGEWGKKEEGKGQGKGEGKGERMEELWYRPAYIVTVCKLKVSHMFPFGDLIFLFGVSLASLLYEGVEPGKLRLITWPPSTQTPTHTHIPNIHHENVYRLVG